MALPLRARQVFDLPPIAHLNIPLRPATDYPTLWSLALFARI